MKFSFGAGILSGLRTDTIGVHVPVRFGALQEISIEHSGSIKELFAVGQFPVSVARGKTKIIARAKVAEINSLMYNEIFFGQTISPGQLKYAYNESTTLGTGTPSYTVTNSASAPLTDQGVFFKLGGSQLTPVSSGPSQGQYAFTASTGIYNFSTHSAGLGILINYTFVAASGFNIAIANSLMGKTPKFAVTLFQQYKGNQIVLVLNRCVSGRFNFPTRIDDYIIQDFDFSASADASGSVGIWSFPPVEQEETFYLLADDGVTRLLSDSGKYLTRQ